MGLPKIWIHHLRLAHNFTNAPVARLTDREFRVHVEALLFLAQIRATDYFIHEVQVPLATGPRRRRTWESLVEKGLWFPVDGGYYANFTDNHDNSVVRISSGRIYSGNREPIPWEISDAVYARDGHTCQICGAIEDLTLDHIVPHSMGGPDTAENLRVLCRSCNSTRGAARVSDDQLRKTRSLA